MMSGKNCFQIGPITTTIDPCNGSSFWDIWKWKLDPYIVQDQKESCELLISISPLEKEIVPKALLRDEKVGFFSHRVYSTETGDMLWQYERTKNDEIIMKYLVSSSWDKIQLLEDNSNTGGNLAFEYLGQIIPSVLLPFNAITFHGVLIEYKGYGIIISAASGVGKTTRARLWRDHKNALIINGDRATCQKVDGVWRGYGLPWSGTSGEQINRNVPLKALVILERGEENKVRRMSPRESFGMVLPHLQCPSWDAPMVGKAMDQMDDFLQNVPVLQFISRPDVDAIEKLCEALEEL